MEASESQNIKKNCQKFRQIEGLLECKLFTIFFVFRDFWLNSCLKHVETPGSKFQNRFWVPIIKIEFSSSFVGYLGL